jgi:hypothetical protein
VQHESIPGNQLFFRLSHGQFQKKIPPVAICTFLKNSVNAMAPESSNPSPPTKSSHFLIN